MKMKIMTTMAIAATILMSGCATTGNPQIGNNGDMSKIEAFVANDKKDVSKELLKTSPVYAQKNQHKAVEENMVKVKNDMPLYRQPLFAQMVVFPYISDAGIYHGYQESWVKIKEGEFVLADPAANAKDEKIFDYNEVSK